VISRVPLVRGLLSGRFNEHATFVEGDRRRQMFAPDRLSAMTPKVRSISDIVASSGLSLVEVAMRFCVSNPHIAVTIPGIRTPEQATANAAACTPLPTAMLDQLRQLA
jgi:aryl-alcohol dehydrogenase-like predicted oxidoreductase